MFACRRRSSPHLRLVSQLVDLDPFHHAPAPYLPEELVGDAGAIHVRLIRRGAKTEDGVLDIGEGLGLAARYGLRLAVELRQPKRSNDKGDLC